MIKASTWTSIKSWAIDGRTWDNHIQWNPFREVNAGQKRVDLESLCRRHSTQGTFSIMQMFVIDGNRVDMIEGLMMFIFESVFQCWKMYCSKFTFMFGAFEEFVARLWCTQFNSVGKVDYFFMLWMLFYYFCSDKGIPRRPSFKTHTHSQTHTYGLAGLYPLSHSPLCVIPPVISFCSLPSLPSSPIFVATCKRNIKIQSQ